MTPEEQVTVSNILTLKSWILFFEKYILKYYFFLQVFPYSIFYVFYEQYLTMWHDTLKSLGISLLAIFVVTFFMMGLDFMSSVISLIVITMILINLCGMMYW